MDGFTGFKTAAVEELPDVVTVLDPFHVTRLAGEALDECRRRVQQAICGHRGRKGDPLYAARRTLSTEQYVALPPLLRQLPYCLALLKRRNTTP